MNGIFRLTNELSVLREVQFLFVVTVQQHTHTDRIAYDIRLATPL